MLALCDEPRYEGFGPTLMAEPLLKVKLVVDHETLRDGRVQLEYRGKQLRWRPLPAGVARKQQPVKQVSSSPKEKTKKVDKIPAKNHPWRRDGVGAGRKYWKRIKAQGRATRLAVRDSGDRKSVV